MVGLLGQSLHSGRSKSEIRLAPEAFVEAAIPQKVEYMQMHMHMYRCSYRYRYKLDALKLDAAIFSAAVPAAECKRAACSPREVGRG